jgi:hypothetical protein
MGRTVMRLFLMTVNGTWVGNKQNTEGAFKVKANQITAIFLSEKPNVCFLN